MRVLEAITRWRHIRGCEITVEGVVQISSSMSVIYDGLDERKTADPIIPGILVHGDQLLKLVQSLPNPLAGYGGSEIIYVTKVRVVGIVANTGHAFAPLKFGHIYDIEFDDKCAGKQSVKVNARLKGIVFSINRTLTALEVKEFLRYFPSFENMVELKKYIESGNSLELVRRVPETQISQHTAFLERLAIEYSPIENGLYGLP